MRAEKEAKGQEQVEVGRERMKLVKNLSCSSSKGNFVPLNRREQRRPLLRLTHRGDGATFGIC